MEYPHNIVLVGPMGAGKTTIGRYIAEMLKFHFIDSDREIEKRCGADIPWIFDIEGEAGFRARETEILNDLCTYKQIVLATGGGAILAERNRKLLKECGKVIYLTASVSQILLRTANDKNRPLLQVDNPREAIQRLVYQRDPLYREIADLIIESENETSPHTLAERIVSQLRYLD